MISIILEFLASIWQSLSDFVGVVEKNNRSKAPKKPSKQPSKEDMQWGISSILDYVLVFLKDLVGWHKKGTPLDKKSKRTAKRK